MTDWQPIDTAPRNGTKIVVADHTNMWWAVRWEKHFMAPARWRSYLGDVPFSPKFWMPMPIPPTMSSGKSAAQSRQSDHQLHSDVVATKGKTGQ